MKKFDSVTQMNLAVRGIAISTLKVFLQMWNADYKETSSDYIREQMEKYMAQRPCPTCDGYRLKEETLAVKVNGVHIGKVTELSIVEADQFFQKS